MQITSGRPFRGSSALASGALTRGTLYGPGYRRLYPDIHIAASAELDLETWSRAAHELVAPYGVLAGYSAAELHDASCASGGAAAEMILLDGYRRRAGPMLVVHLDVVSGDEITFVEGVRVTTPERTAADLARWAPSLTEAIVAVDALSFACGFDPEVVTELMIPGGRGAARVPRVVALADRLSQSPMETRIRLAIVLAGLPPPVSQHVVALAGREFTLDLAYPEVKLGIEYNGADHLRPDRAAGPRTRAAAGGGRLANHPLRRGDSAASPADDRRSSPPGAARPRHPSLISVQWLTGDHEPLRVDQPRTVRPTRWNSFRSE